MPEQIRPQHASRSSNIPVDDEIEAVITVSYLYNPITGQYEVATPGSTGDNVGIKRASDGVLINPATEDSLAQVKADTTANLGKLTSIEANTQNIKDTQMRRTDPLAEGMNTVGYTMDNAGRKLIEGKIFFANAKITLLAVQPNGSVFFSNPAGNTKSITLFKFELSTDVTNEVQYFMGGSSTGAVVTGYNAFFGHPNTATAVVRAGVGVYTPGSQMAVARITNSVPLPVEVAFVLMPGQNATVRYSNTAAQGSNFYATGFWIEESL